MYTNKNVFISEPTVPFFHDSKLFKMACALWKLT